MSRFHGRSPTMRQWALMLVAVFVALANAIAPADPRYRIVPSLLLSAALGQTQGELDQTTAVEVPAAPLPSSSAVAPAATSTAAPPDRWLLQKVMQGTGPGVLFDTNRMAIYGWTEMSFTASSDASSNLPMGFNYLANQFALQQNWLRFERTVVTSGTTEPTFGFRSDTILPGTDYRFTTARGLFSGQLTANDGQPNTYGIDPIQFYVEGYFPTIGRGMDVKIGRFAAQVCVETNDAVSNQLLSHSYTFIYDPFTHTGILTTTKLTDAWSVQAGLALGSDDFIDPVDNPTFLGSVKWAPPNGRDTVALLTIAGNGRFNQARNFNNPVVFDLIWTHQVDARLAYTLEVMPGFQTNVPDAGTVNWLGVVHYLTYTLTPRLSTTGRLEFFNDPQGNRTGFKGLYTDVTAGLNFKLRKGLIVRPELRYDYSDESRPFEDKHWLFTAAADLILRW